MPRGAPLPWLKPGVFAGALVPLAAILVRATRGELGADPIAQALNQLGLVALVFLVAALAATPLKTLFGWTWPIRLRRMLGVFAFSYAALHVVTYTALDQGFDWAAIWADVTKRKFIYVGFATFVLLVPLAITSTNGMVRRLGFVRWKQLHRLAYVATALAVVHFTWRVKKDMREPLAYGAVLTALLLVRAGTVVGRRRAEVRRAT
jgi:sulfoxide reductase heme-binding subunit YedZ